MAAACEAGDRPRRAPEAGNWKDAVAALRSDLDRGKGTLSAPEWRRNVQQLVVSSVGQVRHGERLTDALGKLDALAKVFAEVGVDGETLRERCESARLNHETRNLIQVAQMLATSALQRKESRGGHYRLDYPEMDEAFQGNFYVWNDSGSLRHEMRPVPAKANTSTTPKGVPSTDACVA